nr:hypothetical protein Iba_scaffold2138CG0010 [Ipomoea batatas]
MRGLGWDFGQEKEISVTERLSSPEAVKPNVSNGIMESCCITATAPGCRRREGGGRNLHRLTLPLAPEIGERFRYFARSLLFKLVAAAVGDRRTQLLRLEGCRRLQRMRTGATAELHQSTP